MKAIVFDSIGAPEDVLELRDVPTPRIGDHEALVKIEASSINPGDLLFVRGLYPEPKKPKLPRQIAGTGAAVGRVIEAGRTCSITPGTLVAFGYLAGWAELAAVPEEWLIPLPSDFPIEYAAQINNVISAWDLLEIAGVASDAWLAVTGGYAAVSKILIEFARAKNVKVLAFVRRLRPDVDLEALGATRVLEVPENPLDVRGQIADITDGRGVTGVIDCVGGPLTGELIRSAAFGARVILYGGMSDESFTLHNFDVGLKDLKIGAYVYRYFFEPPGRARHDDLVTILQAAQRLKPSSSGGRYSLAEWRSALRETSTNASRGKSLFVMSAAPSSFTNDRTE